MTVNNVEYTLNPSFQNELKGDTPELRTQLLKWIGNKQRMASEIISFFPQKFNCFYEPFFGSGAVSATLSPNFGIGSDLSAPLMQIWKCLKEDPELLKEWYSSRISRLEHEEKKAVYEDIRDSYNKKPNGADLLFLCRSCYGGVVRFRKSDGYMSTPCGVHMPISAENFAKRVDLWKGRLRNVEFHTWDYKEAFVNAKKGDLIYCDPPYVYSQAILYRGQNFSIEELFVEIERAKSRGVFVALSIDGEKKSGNVKCELHLPEGLFARKIMVNVGRSMLRRFQMEGCTLEGENVQDRLLLTY